MSLLMRETQGHKSTLGEGDPSKNLELRRGHGKERRVLEWISYENLFSNILNWILN